MLLPLRLKNGTTVAVQTVAAPGAPIPAPAAGDADLHPEGAAMGPAAQLPAKELGEAVEVVEGIAEEVRERLGRDKKGMRLKELELGVKVGFDVEGNVFIASGSASASLELKLKWELKEPKAGEPAKAG